MAKTIDEPNERLVRKTVDAVYRCIRDMETEQTDGRKDPIWWFDNLKATSIIRVALLTVAREQRERDAEIARKHIDGIIPYRERRLRGRKLGMLPDEAVAEITSEERGEKIAAEIIEKAIRTQETSKVGE